jgi:hypothetical protein
MADLIFWSGMNVSKEIVDTTKDLTSSEIHLHEANGADRRGCHCMQNVMEGENETYCYLCEMILEKSRGDWAFEWILDLKDWENTLQYEKGCRQLTFELSSEGSAGVAKRIRDKLGTLQTVMVAMFTFSFLVN